MDCLVLDDWGVDGWANRNYLHMFMQWSPVFLVTWDKTCCYLCMPITGNHANLIDQNYGPIPEKECSQMCLLLFPTINCIFFFYKPIRCQGANNEGKGSRFITFISLLKKWAENIFTLPLQINTNHYTINEWISTFVGVLYNSLYTIQGHTLVSYNMGSIKEPARVHPGDWLLGGPERE